MAAVYRARAETATSQLWVASSQASVTTGKIASAIAYSLKKNPAGSSAAIVATT
jgi:hypothetical protein